MSRLLFNLIRSTRASITVLREIDYHTMSLGPSNELSLVASRGNAVADEFAKVEEYFKSGAAVNKDPSGEDVFRKAKDAMMQFTMVVNNAKIGMLTAPCCLPAQDRPHSAQILTMPQPFACKSMSEDMMASDWCFDIPIDHRLKPLLSSQPQKRSRIAFGSHQSILGQYGRESHRSESSSPASSEDGIRFARWLAGPKQQGGLVIALLQPARNQRYTADCENVKNECATLYWLDDILRLIGCSSLRKTSCFDAFPFRLEWPRNKEIPSVMRKAYLVFLQMICQKKPDVILCAWQPPKGFEEAQYCSKGIGATDETETVMISGRPVKLVNAFHPSYATNFHPNESCFRQLFLLETAKAFGELDGRWVETPWMHTLRACCRQRASDLAKGVASTYSPLFF